ncbi:MAG: helix-hairpin-helix domain-containing protein [Desulfomonile sp.]|nr:helix-hairpin-helix domain-containing protein [Desulfomonile sp.]
MTRDEEKPRRITPLHALAGMTLAIVALHFIGRGGDVSMLRSSGSATNEARCVYHVVMDNEALGTIFCREPKPPHAVLTELGVRCADTSEFRYAVPCGSTIRINADGRHIEVHRMSGALLMAAGLRIDVNRAAAEDLEAVPGIGPKLAANIVRTRDTRGPFDRVEDVARVPGIGRKKLEQLEPFLEVKSAASYPEAAAPPVRLASP